MQSAIISVAIWTGTGLIGDYLLIPLLEKVEGIRYLRTNVIIELILLPTFLIVNFVWLKLLLVGLLGFINSGWYAILKGELFSTMPGKSGTVMTLENITGLLRKAFPL